MKAVKLSDHEEVRIDHKIYNGHEGIDVRVWVILKGESTYTPTHQAFWLSMAEADEFFKAFEFEYSAEPADAGENATPSSSAERPNQQTEN
ncbi:MAG: hypothetical protein KF716_27190 [Anaerolineae bacterium]|nr:hypothetical protein [Anaerolineae bacterium]